MQCPISLLNIPHLCQLRHQLQLPRLPQRPQRAKRAQRPALAQQLGHVEAAALQIIQLHPERKGSTNSKPVAGFEGL
jgi:hypothetical protein